jgi:predicted O-methyltransferase YrrM
MGAVVFAEDVPSAVTEVECERLAALAEGRRVLEIGSHLGRSTLVLAGEALVVHSVDLHPADPDYGVETTTLVPFLRNLERYGLRHKVVVHVGLSEVVLPLFRPHSFDLAFIDGGHDRESVERDLRLVREVVTPEGTVAFHDYGVQGVHAQGRWYEMEVTEVVDSFAAEVQTPPHVTGTLAVLPLRPPVVSM